MGVIVAAFSIRIDITSSGGYHMIPLFVERPLLGHDGHLLLFVLVMVVVVVRCGR